MKSLFSKRISTDVPLFAPGAIERLEGHQGFHAAKPYSHLVMQDLFNPQALRLVLEEWPVKDQNVEKHDDGTYVKKKTGTTWKTKFGPHTQRYFNELSSPAFLQTLQKVTNMWGLIPDPYMFGGGLHATATGGKLAVHADYNKHPFFKLDRRLNLLIYLNEGWTEKNGGWLELWDREMKSCVKRILPEFNQTVLFATDRYSFHGQPEPVVGPPNLWRKSIALYYFSNGRADEGLPPDSSGEHSTLWQERPAAGF
ncbi:MAG: 2OG-Fe(II) oxygenase [Bryobacteraceae bacterium]